MTLERHDNIIQRILDVSDRMWITFIADGVHIPFYTLKNYLKIIPPENAIAVTDSTSSKDETGEIHSRRLGYPDWKRRYSHVTRQVASNWINVNCTQNYRKSKKNLNMDETQIEKFMQINPRAAIKLITIDNE